MVVVDPSQSDEELSATIEQIKAVIARADGLVESAYPVFRRRLAYPIGKYTEGIYVLVYFRGRQAVDELKRDMRMSSAIIRMLVVRANERALWLEGPPAPPRREPAMKEDAAPPEAEAEPEAAEAQQPGPPPDEAPTEAEPEPEAIPAEPQEPGPDAAGPQQDAQS
jgi:small subunit ribosomal protein S6